MPPIIHKTRPTGVASVFKDPTVPFNERPPLWKGPEKDGVSYSLLNKFLGCRERFRVHTIEGWHPAPTFRAAIEYGQMWHICEEALAGGRLWETDLLKYVQALAKKYTMQGEEIDKWYNVCKVQFPVYVDFWKKHPDVINRRPLFQEKVFDVPYRLPSGRVVRLRGKWDATDVITEDHGPLTFLQENKSKSDPDEEALARQLKFDLQTMMYLVALRQFRQDMQAPARDAVAKTFMECPIGGVRYNVIRRPLSGGAGSIRQHKPTKSNPRGETKEHFYDRLRGIIDGTGEDAPGPKHFFMRWKVKVSDSEVKFFQERCLDPILENLCVWYDVMTHDAVSVNTFTLKRMASWIHPFGLYNPVDEVGKTDVDEYLFSGSTVGLVRGVTLFPELEG